MNYKKGFIAVLLALALLTACAPKEQMISGSQSLPESSSISQPEKLPALSIKFGSALAEIEPSGQVESDPAVITITSLQELPTIAADAQVTVKLGDKVVYEGSSADLSGFSPAKSGIYLYSVRANDAEYTFSAEVKIEPLLRLESTGTVLGETLLLYAEFAEGQEITVDTDLSHKPTFYNFDSTRMALLPIHYNTKPGQYKLNIKIGSKSFEHMITVNDREFVVQNLTVDETTTSETIESKEANDEWNRRIEPLKKVGDAAKYWQGSFEQPVQGKITTEFGVIRYVNNSPNATRHGGIDIAAPRGTPITAAGNGRILFADMLKLTGYTIIIEHGAGLKSWYYHMDSISVKEGDMVNKGDNVGTVGSTGFSTGPHLHYALSVGGVFINPWTAFEKGIE